MNDEMITEGATVSDSSSDSASKSAGSRDDSTTDVGIIDELLIEEISIDGMCGVY